MYYIIQNIQLVYNICIYTHTYMHTYSICAKLPQPSDPSLDTTIESMRAHDRPSNLTPGSCSGQTALVLKVLANETKRKHPCHDTLN